MQNITSSAALKDAIQLLEVEQEIKGQLLKKQLYIAYESLKPLNLLKTYTERDNLITYMIDNISAELWGWSADFFKKNICRSVRESDQKTNWFFLQFGVTNVVAQNSSVIRSVGQAIFIIFPQKKSKLFKSCKLKN